MRSVPFALNLKKTKGQLECRLNNPKSMMIPTDKTSFKIEGNVEREIFRSYKDILRMANEDETNPNFEPELRKMGNELWERILEPIFKQFDLGLFKNSDLALELSESTVDYPWELALCKKKPYTYLCEILNIGRKRDIVYGRGFYNALGPSREVERKAGSALVVGLNNDGQNDELDLAEKEAENIKALLENRGVSVTSLIGSTGSEAATKESVMKELKRGTNIFHFKGHGSKGKNQCKIFLAKKETINADDFMQELGSRLAPTFSFINACETTVERPTIGANRERYSWAYAMAGTGGRACIGTLWSVWEDGAMDFAKDFYKLFFGGKPIGYSVRQARHSVKAKEKNSEDWPAYALYGPPTLLIEDILKPESPIKTVK